MPSGGPKVPSPVPAHAPGQRIQTQLGAGTPASPRCPSSPNPNPNPNPNPVSGRPYRAQRQGGAAQAVP